MRLTFRAEVMPGRAAGERTFTVARVLANGRVELSGLVGQHTLAEFEPMRPRAEAEAHEQAERTTRIT